MNNLMNKQSGLLGISGVSNDLRSVRTASEEGNERAMLAYDMFSDSVKKYIGQYIAVMGGVDAIVLTAGVGEELRQDASHDLHRPAAFGHRAWTRRRTAIAVFERIISTDDSAVQIIIIPTNEEYMIARDTYEIVRPDGRHPGARQTPVAP